MPLTFSTRELLSEITALESIATKFTARDSAAVLPMFRTSLENIRAQRNHDAVRWEISENIPFRTADSLGDYELDGNGQHNVFAEITSIWDVAPYGNRESGGTSRFVRLIGNASTRVRLFCRTPDQITEIAMWRMEIGDDDAPGCRFHVQVLGERDEFPFPHSLSIPRLPSIMVTPMAVIEFVIGELFQDAWPKEAARGTADMGLWRTIQVKRFNRLLQWQQDAVAQSTGSPWLSLKKAEIAQDLFTR